MTDLTKIEKPQPPKPMECWVVYATGEQDPWRTAWGSQKEAIMSALRWKDGKVIHMREVLE